MFLKSIDGTTTILVSEGDQFRDALRTQGTCSVRWGLSTPDTTSPSERVRRH